MIIQCYLSIQFFSLELIFDLLVYKLPYSVITPCALAQQRGRVIVLSVGRFVSLFVCLFVCTKSGL